MQLNCPSIIVFTVLGQTKDEVKATVEASHAKESSRVDDLVIRLVPAKSYIHFTLSLKYGPTNEPSEPQFAFRHLLARVAEKEESLRVAIVEISTLQVILDIERQGCTLSPNPKWELVRLQNWYGKLSEIAKDL